jgi:hypothetical protein
VYVYVCVCVCENNLTGFVQNSLLSFPFGHHWNNGASSSPVAVVDCCNIITTNIVTNCFYYAIHIDDENPNPSRSVSFRSQKLLLALGFTINVFHHLARIRRKGFRNTRSTRDGYQWLTDRRSLFDFRAGCSVYLHLLL